MDYLKVDNQEPLHLKVMKRASSYQTIVLERRGSFLPAFTRSPSFNVIKDQPHNSNEHLNNTTDHSAFNIENFYRITDFVLVMCSAIFIISSIAYGVLWIYGIANASSDIRIFCEFDFILDEKMYN